MRIQLKYFSESGKWKYEGIYESIEDEMWKVFDEVGKMRSNGNLPGLASGRWDGYIYIDSNDGYPGILMPK